MTEQTKTEQSTVKEIRCLVFNIMGIKLGIDVDQISEIRFLDEVKGEDIKTFWFHEKISFLGMTVIYNDPKVVLVKGEETPSGIVIDQPEDIVLVIVESIQPMPPLIEALNGLGPIWGITQRDEDIILLVDPYKLLACKTITENNARGN